MPSFNLVDESWIPCILPERVRRELSIKETLSKAHEIGELRDQSPLATAALHRLLLAILHRALNGPTSEKGWAKLWQAGSFDKNVVNNYLEDWKHRFNLFDAQHPFYQVSGLEMDAAVPISKLQQEVAAANNPTLFDHNHDDDPKPLHPSEAARALVTSQAFALGGGKSGKTNVFGAHPNYMHAPLVGHALAFLAGKNLFETLMLNLLVQRDELPVPSGEQNMPAWERAQPAIHPGKRNHNGWLDLLTWQSRCIRLICDQDGCVDKAYVAQGEGLEELPLEPMAFYYPDKKAELRQVRVNKERELWRDSATLFALSFDESGIPGRDGAAAVRPRAFTQLQNCLVRELIYEMPDQQWQCFVVGLANDKAKALRWIRSDMPVSRELLCSANTVKRVKSSLELAELVYEKQRAALKQFATELLTYSPSQEARKADKDSVSRMVKSLKAGGLFWPLLERPFKQYLRQLSIEEDLAQEQWKCSLRSAVLESFDQAIGRPSARDVRTLRARVRARKRLLREIKSRKGA